MCLPETRGWSRSVDVTRWRARQQHILRQFDLRASTLKEYSRLNHPVLLSNLISQGELHYTNPDSRFVFPTVTAPRHWYALIQPVHTSHHGTLGTNLCRDTISNTSA